MSTKLPAFRKLPWRPDAALHYFAPLAVQPWAMLLHSGSSEHAHSRFDILTADPLVTLITWGELTEISAAQSVKSSQDDPFTLLQQQIDALDFTGTPHPDFPFLGGALGLFGYDLGRRTETLPQLAEKDIASPDMAVGLYDWALIADHQQQQLTLICHSDPEQRLVWLEQWLEQRSSVLPPVPFRLTDSWHSNMSRQQYGEKFRQIQHWLRSGDCYQVNLAQRFNAHYRGDEWQAFLRLNQSNQAPFSAFLRLPESCVLSLSPERFLWLENRHIQTRPIKGTLPRLANREEDCHQPGRLKASAKDRAENLMIVDLMRNDIGRVAQPGSVRVPELFVVEAFPAVWHLVSTISATLADNYCATDLLRACFPGGSITGAPKIRAMQLIEQLEPVRRNAYCGSVGYISCCGTMDSNICIRTLLTERGTVYCWAGGGIVADSDEEAEYQETFAKLSRILPLFTTE